MHYFFQVMHYLSKLMLLVRNKALQLISSVLFVALYEKANKSFHNTLLIKTNVPLARGYTLHIKTNMLLVVSNGLLVTSNSLKKLAR